MATPTREELLPEFQRLRSQAEQLLADVEIACAAIVHVEDVGLVLDILTALTTEAQLRFARERAAC